MFIRGGFGPKPQWVEELDLSEERAAIQENWIKTGKMLCWHMFSDGFRVIGPKFQGAGEAENLTFEFYAFPTQELFMEWALGAPEHVAAHTKLVHAMRARIEAGEMPLPAGQYNFHATNEPGADIRRIRAELREMYRRIEQTDWAKAPAPGAIQMMMLGDHD